MYTQPVQVLKGYSN